MASQVDQSEAPRFFQLVHPGAPKGLLTAKGGMRMRKQDRRASPCELYAVVFFPKISRIGRAQVNFYSVGSTLSQTPEAAISKFVDGLGRGCTWDQYHDAGHRVRKIKLSDLGDPA